MEEQEDNERLAIMRANEWIGANQQWLSNMNISNVNFLMSDENLTDILISKYDYLDSCISNKSFDSSFNSNLVFLLKFILENGPSLDNDPIYREQIDSLFFTLFRNLLRNYSKCLPDSINLLILRLIEIRACKWKIKKNIEEYYSKKLDKSVKCISPKLKNNQNHDSTIDNEYDMKDKKTFHGLRMSKSFGDVFSQNHILSKDGCSLMKISKPLKINGKGMIKHEMSIKNSDSGKVMGIKGRRIHMIEEMSDTIISFQKVSPNAKERVVQITGYTNENVEKAKNLIDLTIKQNLSPVSIELDNSSTNEFFVEEFSNYSHSEMKPPSNDNYSSHGNNENYCLTYKLEKKVISINISDKKIGKKLEIFLKKYNFEKFILNSSEKNDISHDKKQIYLSYDREFLISIKDRVQTNNRLIQDIQSKDSSLLRN